MRGTRLKKPVMGKNPTTGENGVWFSRGFVEELVDEMVQAREVIVASVRRTPHPVWSDAVYERILTILTQILEKKKKAKTKRKRPLRRTCHRCGKVAACVWTNDPYAKDINGIITENAWWCPVCFGDACDDI